MAKNTSKISVDFEELKKNIRSSATLAMSQINVLVADIAKKAQKDLSQKELKKHIQKILESAKKTKVEDILNDPRVKKLIENPKVQEFLKHEKVQQFISNPRVQEAKKKFVQKAQSVKRRVKRKNAKGQSSSKSAETKTASE
jgi:hypothetical protein